MSERAYRDNLVRQAFARLDPRAAPAGDFCSLPDGSPSPNEPTLTAMSRETGLFGLTRQEITRALRRTKLFTVEP